MLHILIVDDSPPTREISVEQVRALGHRASQAGDGAAALALLERERFDVVLMDLRMPGMDGVETARQIRARHAGGPRVIALSGADRRDRERCLAAGMDGFLTRPVTLAELRAMLEGQPPPSPPPPPGAFDEAYLDDLLAAIGPADLRLAAEPFIAETPGLLASLAGCARHDAETAHRLAHLLKGRALSLGASELAVHAAAAERLTARGGQVSPARLAALDAAFAAAAAALSAYLARNTGA